MTDSLTSPSVPSTDHRMILVLLNSTDPLGLLDAGMPPEAYVPAAALVLDELRTGGGVDEILALFLSAGDRLPAVDAFIRAVMRWWEIDSPARWARTLAAAA